MTRRRGLGVDFNPALLLATAVTVLMLAGCATPPPKAPADPSPPTLVVSCPAPCVRSIDSGVRWEVSVAVDPGDPLHIVASSHDQADHNFTGASGSWGLSHVSFDGGGNWTTVRLPGGSRGDPTHPLFRYSWMDDSTAAFLADGTLLWSALVLDTMPLGAARTDSGASLIVLRSTDGGLTFPEFTVVQEGGGRYAHQGLGGSLNSAGLAADSQDKQWFAVGPDGVFALLVWSRNYSGNPACASPSPLEECTQLVFSTSDDGGRTWSLPSIIIEGGTYSGAFPVILDNGSWVVAFRDTARREANVAVSSDQGKSWKSSVIDATTKFPVLAKARTTSGERLFMAYPASDSGPDGPQVVTIRWSDDGGVVWSGPLALDVPEEDGRTIPAIAPAAGGGAYVTFWHPVTAGAELRAVLVRDGNASVPITLDTTEGATARLGDYMGLAALPGGTAFAVWNARTGEDFSVRGGRLAVP